VEENRGCATELNGATSDRRSEKHAFKLPSYAGGSHSSNAEESALGKAADGPNGAGDNEAAETRMREWWNNRRSSSKYSSLVISWAGQG
jgi:hypothetical protein